MRIIKDTREQKGWEFGHTEKCDGTILGTLKTGDYTIEGMEELLCIERKGSVQEFAQNLMDDRFYRELERTKEFKYAYLILEFELDDLLRYPDSARIPQSVKNKIRINGNFLTYKLAELEMNFPLKVIFAGDRGKDMAWMIFRSIYVKHRQPQKQG